jgi:hypothetical protein
MPQRGTNPRGGQLDPNPQPVPNLVGDPKAVQDGEETVADDVEQAQGEIGGKNKAIETDLSAWLGKQGDGSSGVRQESGSSDNGAQREDMGGQDSATSRLGEPYCTRCRFACHLTKDCRRGQFRGMHLEVERDLPLSGYIAPICATQIEGQTFFCIPERPFEAHAREWSTSVVVTVLKGVVIARQIEEEFSRILPNV